MRMTRTLDELSPLRGYFFTVAVLARTLADAAHNNVTLSEPSDEKKNLRIMHLFDKTD